MTLTCHDIVFCQVVTTWPGNWVEIDAETKCGDGVRHSGISKACEKVSIERDAAVKDCMADIKVCGGPCRI